MLRQALQVRRFGAMASLSTERLLEVATDAARRAAAVAIAQRATGRHDVNQKASIMDIVTAADLAVQRCIEDTLRAAFPEGFADGSVGMLGEEDVEPGSAASAAALAQHAARDVLFVVDPIDGTTMYAHDISLYVVSIGIAREGVVEAGVVYHPGFDEVFAGQRGRGATLNGAPIRVSPETRMRNALWAFGLHSTPSVCGTMLRALTGLTQVSRGCRCLGSAGA